MHRTSYTDSYRLGASIKLLILLLLLSGVLLPQQWEAVGPVSPPDGIEIASNPENSNEVYFASLQAGLYLSTNGGQSWNFEGDFNQFYTRHIKYNRFNPEQFYVVTNGGVFKKESTTTTWVELTEGVSWSDGMSIAIPSGSGDTIVVGTNVGTYRTLDGGLNWQSTNAGFEGMDQYVTVLDCDPSSPQIIYAGTAESLYKSSDFGATWQRLVSFDDSAYLTDIATCSMDPNLIFVTTKHDGIHRSVDGGATWVQVADWGIQVHAIRIKPDDPQVVYHASYSGVFKSTNQGETWAEVLDNGSIGLSTSEQAPNIIYAGTTHDGMFRSDDSGLLWTEMNTGLQGMRVEDVHLVDNDGRYIFICGEGNILRANTQLDEWVDISPPVASSYSQFLTSSPFQNTLYTGGRTLFTSTDNGDSWSLINSGIPFMYLNDLKVHPLDQSTLFLGGSYAFEGFDVGLYKSINDGLTWDHVTDPLIAEASIYTIRFDSLNSNALYIAGSPGVFLSEDFGETWTSIANSLLEGVVVFEIGVSPHSFGDIYACTHLGLFRAERNVWNWEQVGPAGQQVFSITFQNDTSFIATSDGVYMNISDQEEWHEFNDGMGHRDVRKVIYDSVNHSIYAGSYDGGLFKYDFLDTTALALKSYKALPSAHHMLHISPNPANPSIAIVYELSKATKVTMSIFDLTGRQVWSTEAVPQAAGEHREQWNGINQRGGQVTSGLYIATVTTTTWRESRKFVMLR